MAGNHLSSSSSKAAPKPPVERRRAAPVDPAPARKTGRTIFELILVAAVVVLALLLAGKSAPVPASPAVAEEKNITVTYYLPDGKKTDTTAAGAAYTLLPGKEIDGYTFLGWKNAQGYPAGGQVVLYADSAFSAEYAIAFDLDTHEAYMPLDEDSLFRPEDAFTRGAAAELIYSLLDTEVAGSGKFMDVKRSDSFYKATATLKDLGIIGGSRFYPEDAITRGELFSILAAFFPAADEQYSFADLTEKDGYYAAFCVAARQGWTESGASAEAAPNRELTRGEAAHIFNRLLKRSAENLPNNDMVGTLLDVSSQSAYYTDIVEACIPHKAEGIGEAEKWTKSDPLPGHKEGFFFIGTELHCVDESGCAVVNSSYRNIPFGADGTVTTGMPELDELVQDLLAEKVDPEIMTEEEMLKVLFEYCVTTFKYLRGNYYEVGETGWESEEAYKILSTGKGNCYSFAAAYSVLTRALGFDSRSYSGTVDGQRHPHGWTEITIDGVPYIFDTELTFEYRYWVKESCNLFFQPYENVRGWNYVREKKPA